MNDSIFINNRFDKIDLLSLSALHPSFIVSLTWIVMNCWKICTRRRRRSALNPARLDARRRFVSLPNELTALKRGRINDPRSSGSKRRGHWKRITNCRNSSTLGCTRTCVERRGRGQLRGTAVSVSVSVSVSVLGLYDQPSC